MTVTALKRRYRAPVAQWIEHWFPKPGAQVRFLPGASPRSRDQNVAAKQPRLQVGIASDGDTACGTTRAWIHSIHSHDLARRSRSSTVDRRLAHGAERSCYLRDAAFKTTSREAKAASSAQPNGCELLGGRGDGSYQARYRHYETAEPDGSCSNGAGGRQTSSRRRTLRGRFVPALAEASACPVGAGGCACRALGRCAGPAGTSFQGLCPHRNPTHRCRLDRKPVPLCREHDERRQRRWARRDACSQICLAPEDERRDTLRRLAGRT